MLKGIGPSTKNKLLIRFGSVEGIKKASFDDVANLVGPKLANKIKKEFS
jgi:excinuclease UvrABC nuclease subunit